MADNLSRRRYVAGTGAALTLGMLAGCSDDGGNGGDGTDESGGTDGTDESGGTDGTDGTDGSDGGDVPSEIDDYLADARMYDGEIADHTGQDEVTVAVGAGSDGLAFDPAAIRIDSGTTVVWEWTGQGGAHNVASVEGSESDFDSGSAVDDESETFEQSFDNTGVQLYVCTPHEAVGMLGAIEVVEA